MVESVRVYLVVESPAIRPYIEREQVVAIDETGVLKQTVSPVARWLTRRELLAAPESGAMGEALRAWRTGDDSSFDEESAFMEQLASAEGEEMGRGIQGG